MVGLAIAVGPGGFFVEPIGPVRVILGGVISLIGAGSVIGGAGTRSVGAFGGGCFMLGIGLAEMLGVPHCVDCGGV